MVGAIVFPSGTGDIVAFVRVDGFDTQAAANALVNQLASAEDARQQASR